MFPTDDDPFHVICGYSPTHDYYHLYEVDLGNLALLVQKSGYIDLTRSSLEGRVRLPYDLIPCIMWYTILDLLDDKDPGAALEYVFTNRSTLKYVYYHLFPESDLGLIPERYQTWHMIRRIGNYMRLLYKIVEKLENNYADRFLNNQLVFNIRFNPSSFYIQNYRTVYPYQIEFVEQVSDFQIYGEWKCMIPEEAISIGSGYIPFCKGYENRGIWKVYDLAWPLIFVDYTALGCIPYKRHKKSFKIFYDLIKLMFGKYTQIIE